MNFVSLTSERSGLTPRGGGGGGGVRAATSCCLMFGGGGAGRRPKGFLGLRGPSERRSRWSHILDVETTSEGKVGGGALALCPSLIIQATLAKVSRTQRGRNPRSHFAQKKKTAGKDQEASRPHNPAHSWNSIIQFLIPA